MQPVIAARRDEAPVLARQWLAADVLGIGSGWTDPDIPDINVPVPVPRSTRFKPFHVWSVKARPSAADWHKVHSPSPCVH
jgi:hypothetical protein